MRCWHCGSWSVSTFMRLKSPADRRGDEEYVFAPEEDAIICTRCSTYVHREYECLDCGLRWCGACADTI